jgi:hypothetical protein
MGATQPVKNVVPATEPEPDKTLAVRPLANGFSSQHGIGRPLAFPTMQMQMDQCGTSIPHTPAAAPDITARGRIPLRAIVASEIRRYKRITTQCVLFNSLFFDVSSTNGRDGVFRLFQIDPGLRDFTE